jgi:hypothetical protein
VAAYEAPSPKKRLSKALSYANKSFSGFASRSSSEANMSHVSAEPAAEGKKAGLASLKEYTSALRSDVVAGAKRAASVMKRTANTAKNALGREAVAVLPDTALGNAPNVPKMPKMTVNMDSTYQAMQGVGSKLSDKFDAIFKSRPDRTFC